MNGPDYVATTNIYDQAGDVRAAVGELCTRVDARSLPSLLEQGCIAPVVAPASDGSADAAAPAEGDA